MNRWLRLKKQVLTRPIPHAVVSWRYLLPGQSDAVKMHRQVFLRGWLSLHRFSWCCITLYSLTLWFGYYSWRLLLKAFFQHRQYLRTVFHISLHKHFFDLCKLCIFNGISPRAYYQYQLFRQPEKEWLNYIYNQELPHWHQVLSSKISNRSQERIRDKHLFYQTMQDNNIDCVATVYFIPQGHVISYEVLFSKQSWFGKPNQGNQGMGAFVLTYDAYTDQYQLKSALAINNKQCIITTITTLTKNKDYLLQPLLENHPDITHLCGTNTLCTLRIVTGFGKKPLLLYATLEIPINNNFKSIHPIRIDPSSGLLCAPKFPSVAKTECYDALNNVLEGTRLPYWSEAKQLCFCAHQQFRDVATVGWDVVISSEGVKLLEGNLNWQVSTSQMLEGVGALATKLGHYYRHHLV